MENNILVNIKAWITAALAVLTAFWGWFGWLVIVWGLILADWPRRAWEQTRRIT